jgi:hypothetical protein
MLVLVLITNHRCPLHAAAGALPLLLSSSLLVYSSHTSVLTSCMYGTSVRTRETSVYHVSMPPQGNNNVIPPHVHLITPSVCDSAYTYMRCAPMPPCRITLLGFTTLANVPLLPLTVPACCPFPQRLSATLLARS